MPSYKVQTNIPVPQNNLKYPVEQLEVGDSFFVDTSPNDDIARLQKNIMSAAMMWAKRRNLSYKYKTQRTTDSECPGVRLWRIK